MTIKGHLLHMLEVVAVALGDDLRKEVVFVGGCTTALFITDAANLEDVRATYDVDVIVDLTGYPDWVRLQEALRTKGFQEAQDESVLCRMRLGDLKVDFMPTGDILGFSNHWYRRGVETAESYAINADLSIRLLTPPLFLATKFEAFLGRGKGDLLSSQDMEDILLVVDGRPEIVEEVSAVDDEVRQFISEQFQSLLSHKDFDYFLEGNIRGPEGRLEIVHGRIVTLSQSDR